MYLETVLILIAGTIIVLIAFAHRLIIEPGLERSGFKPRGVGDVLLHRDWKRYRYECGGSPAIYWFLWFGYLLVVSAIALQVMQFVLFPGFRFGA